MEDKLSDSELNAVCESLLTEYENTKDNDRKDNIRNKILITLYNNRHMVKETNGVK